MYKPECYWVKYYTLKHTHALSRSTARKCDFPKFHTNSACVMCFFQERRFDARKVNTAICTYPKPRLIHEQEAASPAVLLSTERNLNQEKMFDMHGKQLRPLCLGTLVALDPVQYHTKQLFTTWHWDAIANRAQKKSLAPLLETDTG